NRPVIVVSNDVFNSRFDVVTVVPLTKLEGKSRRLYPFEYILPVGTVSGGVTSIVQAYQIRTISKVRILEKMGSIVDPEVRHEIESRILEHLGIEFDPEE
ncbi:MAG TPA: type II toxin-antitoxin system PemK/MazF family toxin, partial [Longimicrobium sp.]|nr:type II toxin-antitoxin system PemK/MazF family toxin [Longimicrobium sp.]